jgi:very-short-patch-repair endonuclease
MSKKRNINKKLYPSKWEEFCEKYGEVDAVEYYYKFSRSFCEEKYILKYGEKEGKQKFQEKKQNIDRGMSLKSCIRRYGEDNGRRKHEEWKLGVRQSKDNFIKRYGKDLGEEKFKEFSKKAGQKLQKFQNKMPRQTILEYWIKKCNGDIGKAKEEFKKRQQTSTLDKYIKKYGKEDGLKKYQENNKKKARTIENFIDKYGDIKGPEKYYQWIERLKYSHTKDRYIKKYGKEEGLRKYRETIRKKIKHIYKNRQSIIGLEFCESLNEVIGNKFENIYFGDKEYKFFVWENNIKIAVVDFYVKDINVIVEFYGDYWHRNPKKYNDKASEEIREKDKNRIETIIKKFGSKVFIVWEEEYTTDREKVLKNIVKKMNRMIR